VQQLQEAEGYRACPADQRAPYLLRALVHDSTLSRAADCLGSALGVVNRALKRHAASAGNVKALWNATALMTSARHCFKIAIINKLPPY
jgi:hypothetical protein